MQSVKYIVRTGPLKVLNLHFPISKSLKVLNLPTSSVKVLNFIFLNHR